MYQTCFTSVLMWMKQKDTSTVQEKQKNTNKVQEKCMKYIETNPSVTTNTFLLSSKISASANLAMFRVKKCMEFQASWEKKQAYTVIRNKHKMSDTLRNIGRKQEGISLGIRRAEGSLHCRVQLKGGRGYGSCYLQDFRLLPWSRWDLHSSGILQSIVVIP